MEADRPFRRLFRKGKRLFRRGYGHEHRYRPSSQAGNYRGRPLGRLRSKAEVSLPPPFHHRRPPKHRSRSVARCRATDTGRPRRFPAPAPRCRGQLRARSGHPRADRARRAPHARTFVARLPRLRLEPSGVLRAEGPGPPSHDAGPPRIAPGHLRRHRRRSDKPVSHIVTSLFTFSLLSGSLSDPRYQNDRHDCRNGISPRWACCPESFPGCPCFRC